MRKSVKVAVMAVFAFVVGINVYKSQTDMNLSNGQLANVEALASVKPDTSTHSCVRDGIYCELFLNGEKIFSSTEFRVQP